MLGHYAMHKSFNAQAFKDSTQALLKDTLLVVYYDTTARTPQA